MQKWEMIRVRTEGRDGPGTYEHFTPDEWIDDVIVRDKSRGEQSDRPALHRFIMNLLEEGWEPLSIFDNEPSFSTRKITYVFRRAWQGEVEAGEVEQGD